MKEYVRTIADYPVKGIQFRDITTLLQNAGHLKKVIDDMTVPWKGKKIDAVLSIESRGFIMAGAIAYFLICFRSAKISTLCVSLNRFWRGYFNICIFNFCRLRRVYSATYN